MGDDNLFPKITYKRTNFTPKQREEAMAKTGWLCALCKKPAEEIDHIIPVAIGGLHVLENWEPLCVVHHKIKTAEDVKLIRKADRMAGRRGSQYNRRKAKGSSIQNGKKPWPKRTFPKMQKKLGT